MAIRAYLYFVIFYVRGKMPDIVLIISRRSRGPKTKEKLIFIMFYQMFTDVKTDHLGDLGASEKSFLFFIIMFTLRRLLARMACLRKGLKESLKKNKIICILLVLLPVTKIRYVGRRDVQNARATIWSKDGRSLSFVLYSPKRQVSMKRKVM